MPRISPIIEGIVAGINNGVYLRATSQEANIELDDLDLEGKVLVIYVNLPDVANRILDTSHVVSLWSIELQVLKLADFDDDDKNSDILREDCLRVAEFIIDTFPTADTERIEDYDIEFAENFKLYDKTMTGLTLSFDAPIDRTVYCDDLNP